MTDDKTPPEDLESTKSAEPLDSGPTKRIGPYKILQKIGEGGMGEVYLAEQEKPIRRRVALKIIKLGMDSKQVIARFEAERQALALMNHPNVAKIFDAGATEQGRPYFAMEFVKGEPITQYCDKHRLTTEERLQLFMQACEGVQHAHQKGTIHRDIKPSNVLVSVEGDKPVPKIIDFGVAKATEHRLTENTVYTELGILIGTPEYMSPEQAEMTTLDIDTRTDVYSLGVLLYELLVGALPFDSKELRQGGFDEIRRRIREEEPSKPSTKLASLEDTASECAGRRHTDVGSLTRQLRGDLDWITMKAIEKDRTRRYGSPAELATEVKRHLTDQPVLAGPPNPAYRLTKFLRRNRTAVIAAASLALALALLTVTLTMQARTRKTRLEASRRQDAEILTSFGSCSSSAIPDRVKSAIDRIRNRVESGTATTIDLSMLIRALTCVEIKGRSIQSLDDVQVGLHVGPLGYAVGNLGVVVEPRMSLNDDPVHMGSQFVAGFQESRCSSVVALDRSDYPIEPGLYTIRGAFEARLVRTGFKCVSESNLEDHYTQTVSDSFSFSVPEFHFAAVADLPPGFPMRIDDERLSNQFVGGTEIEPIRVNRTADHWVGILELRLPPVAIPAPLRVAVRSTSLDGWEQVVGTFVLWPGKGDGIGDCAIVSSDVNAASNLIGESEDKHYLRSEFPIPPSTVDAMVRSGHPTVEISIAASRQVALEDTTFEHYFGAHVVKQVPVWIEP